MASSSAAQRLVVDLEDRGRPGLCLARPDQVGRGFPSQHQPERRQQQALARPGLSRPGAETALQLDLHVLDQRQVLYRKFTQHDEGASEPVSEPFRSRAHRPVINRFVPFILRFLGQPSKPLPGQEPFGERSAGRRDFLIFHSRAGNAVDIQSLDCATAGPSLPCCGTHPDGIDDDGCFKNETAGAVCSNTLVSNPHSHYTTATTPVAATRTMQECRCAAARIAQPDGTVELADAPIAELPPDGAGSRLPVVLDLPGRQPGYLVAQPRDLARRGHVHRPGRQSLLRPGIYHLGLVSKPRHAVRWQQSALLALPLPVDPGFRF